MTTTTAASGNGATGDRSAEQAAHTPGPWFHTFNPGSSSDGEVRAGERLGVAIVLGSNWGEWRDAPDGGDAEFEANARLIAAAPDMLAALQAVAADRFAMMLDPNTCDDVLAAIAKATGTAPANRDAETQDTTGVVPK